MHRPTWEKIGYVVTRYFLQISHLTHYGPGSHGKIFLLKFFFKNYKNNDDVNDTSAIPLTDYYTGYILNYS